MDSIAAVGHYNRYELLFMDDNDIVNPSDGFIIKKKKQTKNVNDPTTTTSNTHKNLKAAATSAIPSSNTNNKSPKKHKVEDNQKSNNIKVNLEQRQAEKQNKQPSNNNKYDIVTAKKLVASSVRAIGISRNPSNSNSILTEQDGSHKNKNNGENNRSLQQHQRNDNFKQQQQEPNIKCFNASANELNGNGNKSGNQSLHGTSVSESNQSQSNRQHNKIGERSSYKNRNHFQGGSNRKREFDKQSISERSSVVGIKNMNKRDSGASYNWGGQHPSSKDNNDLTTRKNKISSTTAIYNNSTIDKTQDNPRINTSNNNVNSNATEKIKEVIAADTLTNDDNKENIIYNEKTITEPERKEWTLDEWKAQQQQRIKPQFNIRKAGEGEDTTQWKKMIVLNKKNKINQFPDEELYEYDPAMYPQRVGRQQRILDIQFHFNDGRRTAGAITGYRRGGVRGATSSANHYDNKPGQSHTTANYNRNQRQFNTGNNKSNHQHQHENAAPKVNDESQFPTLV